MERNWKHVADVYLHTCHGLKGSTAGTQLQVLSTEHLLHLASKKVTEPQIHVCWKESLAVKWSYILFKAGTVRAGWSGLAQLHFEYPEEWRLYSLSGHLLQCLTTLTGGERGSLKKKKLLVSSHSLHRNRITCVLAGVSSLLPCHHAPPWRDWIHLLYILALGSYRQH